MSGSLDGALVEIIGVYNDQKYYYDRNLGSEIHIRLLPEYEHLWSQPEFWLPPANLKFQRNTVVTAEELEAAKQRTTEVLRELESLP